MGYIWVLVIVVVAALLLLTHPLALQLRNLQSLVEIGVDKNTMVVFPAPLMSTIGELGAFLAREATAADNTPTPAADTTPAAARPMTSAAEGATGSRPTPPPARYPAVTAEQLGQRR